MLDMTTPMTRLPGLLAELEMVVLPATKNEALSTLTAIIDRAIMLKARIASLGNKKRELKRRIRF